MRDRESVRGRWATSASIARRSRLQPEDQGPMGSSDSLPLREEGKLQPGPEHWRLRQVSGTLERAQSP